MNKAPAIGLVSTLIISISVVLAAEIVGSSAVRAKSGNDVISVTGSATMPIKSDLIIWTGTVTGQSPTMFAAYQQVKSGTAQVIGYLKKNGVDPADISTAAIQTNPQTENVVTASKGQRQSFQQTIGYILTQQVTVRSKNVDLVNKVSRNVTDLLSSGINFQSNPPEFLYTKVDKAKIEILSKATADARNRAVHMAQSAGARLGTVRSMRMEPLQITPRDSTQLSYDGAYDTTTRNKSITAIVKVKFGVH